MSDMMPSILFKERETDFVYEVQQFDDFVMVRPASKDFYDHLERLTWSQFTDRFDEFWGHSEEYMLVSVVSTAAH